MSKILDEINDVFPSAVVEGSASYPFFGLFGSDWALSLRTDWIGCNGDAVQSLDTVEPDESFEEWVRGFEGQELLRLEPAESPRIAAVRCVFSGGWLVIDYDPEDYEMFIFVSNDMNLGFGAEMADPQV